ncbi:16S rRNA (guanine527-N7)-methyltransferase [Falsiroseomonas stagni DSM 19981]|uniref:Ribosomal RNA small subunit methyltransferase G n=1 Tax=Falsiroseomonas stagni DSM 19981 TaxID=1123062 RepID=A0A1I4A0A9_9PROT|nr:16S rRNA (guanine527-N7)-methyltransferase [Falsiroseomonas stagni DSM 19981]
MFHVKQPPPPTLSRLPDCAPPDAAQQAMLDAYLDLLIRWNSRINLVADAPAETLRQRHIRDCLQLAALVPPGDGPMADLGAGAGLPGLVLAIATGRPTHLVESDRRKAAFLTEAAARLDLKRVKVHPTRIEDAILPPLDLITARALAPLDRLLPHAARLLAPGGIAIFPKGRTADLELAATRPAWTCQVERFASQTDPEATIFRLSDIRHASPEA